MAGDYRRGIRLETDGTITDGKLRVRFGAVEARGVALTPNGRARYDLAFARPDPSGVWAHHFPATDHDLAAAGLAYYQGGDPAKPVVYRDFPPGPRSPRPRRLPITAKSGRPA